MTPEKNIELELIEHLERLGYTYRSDIKDKETLEKNFLKHFNDLNYVELTDAEFERLKSEIITKDVFQASKLLRETHLFDRDDRTPLYYKLVDTDNWCQNNFEVVNQLRINTENSYHIYDVVILINGLPVVQIELKSYAVTPRKAMEQIVKYKNDKGNAYTNSLLCFTQLFIVSNKNKTFYFANNNAEYFNFNADERFLPVYMHADKENNLISDLEEFTNDFLEKCTLGELIGKFMVLVETEKRILIMRPYQINAVKAIISCVDENRGNGYIWHTTGSGKTLTSFKASTLLKNNPKIDKCLFVVDRKDLDSQTRDEFNRFQKNCVEENTNTESLVEKLISDELQDKIIVTTIQKLGIAIDMNSKQNKNRADKGIETFISLLTPMKDKRVVIIFDECHRSQFGQYHKNIKDFFPNSQLFGFTGTPIFEANATKTHITNDNEKKYKTTEDIFEKALHTYTITNAINDENVLKFHIDYYEKTDREDNTNATPRIVKQKIAEAILEKHTKLTNDRRFNALFATARINDAIEYYEIFKSIQQENDNIDKLNIACIFSPPAEGNRDIEQLQEDLEQEKEDNKTNPNEKKEALINIINDYNLQYNTNYSINNFDEYYKDIQRRIKDQQYKNDDLSKHKKIDIVIVVDMLLTGFDSKYLNTLYVDKNLKYHGLIQAFSRTNRILNIAKPYGNIVDFRSQQSEVDEAITLFSGLQNEEQSRQIWIVENYSEVKKKLENSVNTLKEFMEKHDLEFKPSDVCKIKGNIAKLEFIQHFKDIQSIKTQLDQYTEMPAEEKIAIENLIPEDIMKGFRCEYLDIAKELNEKYNNTQNDDLTDDEKKIYTNTDFEFVLFSSAIIDYDYIISLISKYTFSSLNKKEKMTKEQLIALLRSNANFFDERDDIVDYVESLQVGTNLTEEEIKKGYATFKQEKRNNAISHLAREFNIDNEILMNIVEDTINNLRFDSTKLGELFSGDLGWKERAVIEDKFMQKLIPILKKMANGREIRSLNSYE